MRVQIARCISHARLLGPANAVGLSQMVLERLPVLFKLAPSLSAEKRQL